MRRSGTPGIIGRPAVISHLEVLPNKLTAKGVDEEDYLALFDAEHFVEIEINTNVLLRAREIRDFYSKPAADGQNSKWMDLGDAIHLATASILGVIAFHSRDGTGRSRETRCR